MSDTPAVKTVDLEKSYGTVQALDGVDITVPDGSFFGLLGPNGAGKTTFINILVGLVSKTSGDATVFGHDVEDEYQQVRDAIGLAPQEVDIDRFFSIREVLVHKAGYHGVPHDEARDRADHLMDVFGIADKKNKRVFELSGGMKRRLLLARALVTDPDLLILDEPTAGVDVELRRELWDIMQELNREGRTILLTTHYIEEAEQLCEQVAIMSEGEVLEVASPESFTSRGDDVVHIEVDADGAVSTGIDEVDEEYDDGVLTVWTEDGITAVPDIIKSLQRQDIAVVSVETEKKRLEDVFVDMTMGDNDE